MKDAKKYFNRNGYVYGGVTNFDHERCSRQTFRFSNWEEVQLWLDAAENSNQKRELLTKSEALKYGFKY